ncbi:MAG: hypothetical protein R2771_02065 [Saprospiraceae bacterium]
MFGKTEMLMVIRMQLNYLLRVVVELLDVSGNVLEIQQQIKMDIIYLMNCILVIMLLDL